MCVCVYVCVFFQTQIGIKGLPPAGKKEEHELIYVEKFVNAVTKIQVCIT